MSAVRVYRTVLELADRHGLSDQDAACRERAHHVRRSIATLDRALAANARDIGARTPASLLSKGAAR
ncbi:MAG: hypothetical protein OXJ64_09025 [Boseongicola sp.]|nr:hypothetical protein [Boseongicola sp.]